MSFSWAALQPPPPSPFFEMWRAGQKTSAQKIAALEVAEKKTLLDLRALHNVTTLTHTQTRERCNLKRKKKTTLKLQTGCTWQNVIKVPLPVWRCLFWGGCCIYHLTSCFTFPHERVGPFCTQYLPAAKYKLTWSCPDLFPSYCSNHVVIKHARDRQWPTFFLDKLMIHFYRCKVCCGQIFICLFLLKQEDSVASCSLHCSLSGGDLISYALWLSSSRKCDGSNKVRRW